MTIPIQLTIKTPQKEIEKYVCMFTYKSIDVQYPCSKWPGYHLATCMCGEVSQCVSWIKCFVTLVPFVTPLPCSRHSVPVAVQVFLASNCRASTRWQSNSRQGYCPGGWRNRAGSSEETQWLVCFAFDTLRQMYVHTHMCTPHTHIERVSAHTHTSLAH